MNVALSGALLPSDGSMAFLSPPLGFLKCSFSPSYGSLCLSPYLKLHYHYVLPSLTALFFSQALITI